MPNTEQAACSLLKLTTALIVLGNLQSSTSDKTGAQTYVKREKQKGDVRENQVTERSGKSTKWGSELDPTAHTQEASMGDDFCDGHGEQDSDRGAREEMCSQTKLERIGSGAITAKGTLAMSVTSKMLAPP